jgi:hypothetical protein
MFGYRVEADFDPSLEKRRSRFIWACGIGLCSLIVGYFIRPFEASVFQCYFITCLSYGDTFYVRRAASLRETWLWRTALATIPIHLLLLATIIAADRAFPTFVPKPTFYIPALTVMFAIEATVFDRLATFFQLH